MKKKSIYLILISLALVTVLFVIAGLIFKKEENEKQQGLTNQYDVSTQGTFAYVTHHQGKPQLNLYNPDLSLEEKVIELKNDEQILDPTFSYEGDTLAFITTDKNQEEDSTSTVHLLDLRSKKVSELFHADFLVTELDFTNQGRSLFYIGAGTYKNYSPIAGPRPHDLDIYEFDFDKNESTQLTTFKKYGLSSLHVTGDGKAAYYQTDDDEDAKTADEIFETHQRIFKIEFKNRKIETVSDPERDVDVFDFIMGPDERTMVFQSIANEESGGNYIYELYTYDLKTKTEKQLTHLNQYTERPVFSSDSKTVYFMVDKKFGVSDPQYHLYKVDIDGGAPKEIILPRMNK